MATTPFYSSSGPSFLPLVRLISFLSFILTDLHPAVAARFGIGRDFWLNLFLTLAGYIPGRWSFLLPHPHLPNSHSPGHMHNFYIQNIRNNKNHRRTPRWAQRYGLVDTADIKRKERRSQWASRYDERLPNSTLNDRPVEEGQNPDVASLTSSTDSVARTRRRAGDGELWGAQDEQYYGQSNGSSESRSQRWQYPANFDDASESPDLGSSTLKKKKKAKKDRFARTEDAYTMPEDTTRRRKKKRSNRSIVGDDDARSERSGSTALEAPEDPEGGQYGGASGRGAAHSAGDTRVQVETNFDHQF